MRKLSAPTVVVVDLSLYRVKRRVDRVRSQPRRTGDGLDGLELTLPEQDEIAGGHLASPSTTVARVRTSSLLVGLRLVTLVGHFNSVRYKFVGF